MAKKKTQDNCSRRRFIRTALAAGAGGGVIGLNKATGVQTTPPASLSASAPAATTLSSSMTGKQVRQRLIDFMQGLTIIDTHEHLSVETKRIDNHIDVLWLISHYAWNDIQSAGFKNPPGVTENFARAMSIPLEKRFKAIWPYLQQVKHGSFYRPSGIALRDIYGIDDLSPKNFITATEHIRANNSPGLYHRILRDRCKIQTCLVQNGKVVKQQPKDLLTPVYNQTLNAQKGKIRAIKKLSQKYRRPIRNLDTFLQLLKTDMAWARDNGAVTCKTTARPQVPCDMKQAAKDFRQLIAGGPPTLVLECTILDFILQTAGQWNWPVAVHTGVWNDFRTSDPKHMLDILERYPNVLFDIYHLGMPYARDCIFIAKNYPNAHLNLCWCYIVSQEITRRSINEILDTVPVNKIFAFGGDYPYCVENVYGHLVMARETLADAFAERIGRGQLNLPDAEHILKLWLWDNPVHFYRLG